MYKIIRTNYFTGAKFEQEIERLLRAGWELHGTPFRCDQFANLAQAMKRIPK